MRCFRALYNQNTCANIACLQLPPHLSLASAVVNTFVNCSKFSTSQFLLNSNKMPELAQPILKFTKAIPEAFEPVRGSAKAAGFDLKSAEDCIVPARGKYLVNTGLQIQLPAGCYGRVAPRSGLAVKNFIDVGAGVIDEDYRGIVKVVLFNHSKVDFVVQKGDRIAQLICERVFYPLLQEEKALSETERGEGGFGSTGIN